MGVPGVYMHGLLDSINDTEAITEGKSARSINRNTLKKNALIEALSNRESTTYKISSHFGSMIKKRIKEKAFHPNAEQKVLRISDSVFAVLRTSVDGRERIFAVTNVTGKTQNIEFSTKGEGFSTNSWLDILTGHTMSSPGGEIHFHIEPYGVHWFKAQ